MTISKYSSPVLFSFTQHRMSQPSQTSLIPHSHLRRPLYELSNYFMLSRILYYVPYESPIHPGRVFITFGFISSAIEALNANGAVLVSNSSLPQHKQNTGKALLKAALMLQLGVLC